VVKYLLERRTTEMGVLKRRTRKRTQKRTYEEEERVARRQPASLQPSACKLCTTSSSSEEWRSTGCVI